MHNERFQQWAGISIQLPIRGAEGKQVWPIIDSETCGDIDGFPRYNQFFCFATNPEDQKRLCEVLNERTN